MLCIVVSIWFPLFCQGKSLVTSELWVVRFELLSKRSRNTNWSLQVERSRLKAHNLSIFPYHEVTELKRSTKMCVWWSQMKQIFLIYHQTTASTWYKNTIILRVSNALSGFYKLLAFAQTVLPYIKISHFHSTLKVC